MNFSLKISRLEEYNRQRQQAGLWNRLMWLDTGSDVLFAHASSIVFLPITDKLSNELNELAFLLKEAIDLSKSAIYLQMYTDLILLNINRCFVQCGKGVYS